MTKTSPRNPILSRSDNAELLKKYVNFLPGRMATVQSQSDDKIYHVNYHEGSCECADSQYRGTYCKHQQAVDLAKMEPGENELIDKSLLLENDVR